MSHSVVFHWIVVQIFIAQARSEAVVRGVMGQSTVLPCLYQVTKHTGISDMCWGRGPCPNSKCNEKILHTTGKRVTFQKSQGYNLWGSISDGDVSLTIEKVKAEDEGIYCCRVEIPGWFNDIKQNIRLEVITAPPVTTTTTRKAPISPKRFKRTTTVAPQATSGHQTTAVPSTVAPQATSDHQTTAVPSTVAPQATSEHQTTAVASTVAPQATSDHQTTTIPVITLEATAAPTFAVMENYAFQETTVAISTSPDFSADFQADDMRTGDYDELFISESVPLIGVTTELLSRHPAAEETESAQTSLMLEALPVTEISTSSVDKAEKHGDNGDKFLSYATLVACLLAVSILFILVPSLLVWKRKHTQKFIMKSLRPAGDLEKVFSGPEGETSMLSL